MANFIYHQANTRGNENHGWLHTFHTFSFANYYSKERIHFGALRVLNDDTIDGGMGFDLHPHDNMEIITIPLEGELLHKDSMGNAGVIKSGDVQVMSAGTGVEHSEYNRIEDKQLKLLQIWVFPNKKDVKPRYDQISLNTEDLHNRFHQIVSPSPDDEGVWIHQDAWFYLAKFDKGVSKEYLVNKEGDGVYAFIINGEVTIEDQKLRSRDGLGIWDTDSFMIQADSDAEFLLMEVPMIF